MFQGGSHCEIFSAQSKDSISQWKVAGNSGIKKDYDKEVRSYVYTLEGNSTSTRMQLPKDSKQSLGLIQPYLILQVYIPMGMEFSVDIGITDTGNVRRRLVLSTAHKETKPDPLHCKIPLGMVKRAVWLNLCFDMTSLVDDTWREQTYKSIESICISACCKIRRIFTMRKQPPDTTDELPPPSEGRVQGDCDPIPKTYSFAPDLPHDVQVISMPRVRMHERGLRGYESGGSASSRHSIHIEHDLNSSGGKSQASEYHIAFGSKVAGTSRPEPRKGSGKEGGTSSRQHKSSHTRTRSDSGSGDASNTSRSSRAHSKDKLSVEHAKGQSQRERKNSDPGTNTEDPEITVDKESLRTSHTWTDGADNKEDIPFVHPHPPRQPSSEKRRKPRVKSAGKERSRQPTAKDQVSSPQSNDRHSSHSPGRYHSNGRTPPRVADDQEVERYMREVSQGSHQEYGKSESESDPGSNNSSVIAKQSNESISEVISTLNQNNDIAPYEDSEEEGELYTYSSKPQPLRDTNQPRKNKKSHTEDHRIQSSSKRNMGTESRLDMDFVRSTSTDEEDSLRFDRNKAFQPIYVDTRQPTHAISAKNNGFLNVPPAQKFVSPQTSQSRISMAKSCLREIPQEEIRKSGGSKPYEADKYQMMDFSNSCEAQMLAELKKENLEEGLGSSDEDNNQVRDKPRGLSRSKINYGNDDDLSNFGDDTRRSTDKAAPSYKAHNYQEEMGVLSQEFLTQSNPREWGIVFSPPIVLPSNNTTSVNPSTVYVPPSNNTSPGGPNKSQFDAKSQDRMTGEEDKLELLFDPVLNVYFDPRTRIYYELKP